MKYKFGIGRSETEKWIENHLKWFFLPVQFWFSSGRGTGIPTPVFLSRYDWELMKKTAPKIGILAYEELIEKAGGMKFREIIDLRPTIQGEK